MNNIIDLYKDENWKDIIYTSQPNSKRIREFKKYLRDNKDKIIRLYHGTSSKIDIMNQGLKPTSNKTKKSLQSQNGYVYLSIYPTMAKTFGEMAYPMHNITVYSVEVFIKDLKVDTDQLRNKRYWGQIEVGNTLVDSIIYGHGARVKGWIEPYKIKKREV